MEYIISSENFIKYRGDLFIPNLHQCWITLSDTSLLISAPIWVNLSEARCQARDRWYWDRLNYWLVTGTNGIPIVDFTPDTSISVNESHVGVCWSRYESRFQIRLHAETWSPNSVWMSISHNLHVLHVYMIFSWASAFHCESHFQIGHILKRDLQPVSIDNKFP